VTERLQQLVELAAQLLTGLGVLDRVRFVGVVAGGRGELVEAVGERAGTSR
jgi:hypothetical protein